MEVLPGPPSAFFDRPSSGLISDAMGTCRPDGSRQMKDGAFRRPSPAELEAAHGRTLPDVIASGLRILFCGINPSLYSAAVGHHFARPGNRFWPALAGSGLTPRLYSPVEDGRLLELGMGITNLVETATRSAAELGTAELRAGARRLRARVRRHRPAWLAVLGVGAYHVAFGPGAPGPQPLCIGSTRVWLLPNTSGLNAAYQLGDLVLEFARLGAAAGTMGPADAVP
jgi:TDG/mug DNA glycosylase family protein